MNHVHGINKVFGKVRGDKDIFLVAQNPGAQENKQQKELVGPSGEFLWQELARVGIKRKHCEIQNAVRCWTVDVNPNGYPHFKSRSPSKEEVKCCSYYTEKALAKSNAKLYLIFGNVAQAAVLKKEFRKDKKIFYSESLRGWVVCLTHPAFFIRQGFQAGDERPPTRELARFREDLQKVKQLLKKKSFDKFGFLKEQKYVGVVSSKQALKVYHELKKLGESGVRLVYDMESGQVKKGKPNDQGETVALCCGFTARPGNSYTFALEHPDAPASRKCRRLNRRLVSKLLLNPRIPKSAHYGVADEDMAQALLGVRVRGFDYDTLLGEFFRDPDAKAYGLAKTAERRFPDFMNYKDIRWPEAFTEDYAKQIEGKKISLDAAGEAAESTHKMNLARLPWDKMVIYNGADCHLEKLIEESTKKYVNQPLMKVYLDASFILFQMERDPECQPLFDYEWNKKLYALYGPRRRQMERKLRRMAGKYAYVPKRQGKFVDWKHGERNKQKFNMGNPLHVNWLIYDHWKIPVGPDGRTTAAPTLERLAINHKKVRKIPRFRSEMKVETTYLDSYKACADLNDGHLRTNWKLTGTSTGRLSSGATKDRKNLKVINFQNVHGDPFIKCQMVSDLRWRKIYKYWRKYGDFTEETWKRFADYYVELGFDFSQNELRQLAEESGDKNLIKAFAGGGDPHSEVGHEITGWSRELIKSDDRVRRVIKAMHFGIVFGLQGDGLYQHILREGVETTREEVDEFLDKYFRKYPGVKWLQKQYRDFVEKHGYVINQFGFRRKINVHEQKQAEAMGEKREGGYWKNKAINTPIQSASHHFLTMALAVLRRKPKTYKLLKHPQKEIHDSLHFRLKLKYMLRAAKLGHDLMVKEPMRIAEEEFGIKKRVPLATEPTAGFRFGVHVGELSSEWTFLNEWCKANRELERDYRKQLHKLHASS